MSVVADRLVGVQDKLVHVLSDQPGNRCFAGLRSSRKSPHRNQRPFRTLELLHTRVVAQPLDLYPLDRPPRRQRVSVDVRG